MDDNVIAGLIKVAVHPWEALGEHYSRYLDLAKDSAYEFATELDVIERRLFALGS